MNRSDPSNPVRVRGHWLLLARAQWMAASSIGRARLASGSRALPSFVLLSRGRTGSTLLVDLLNCHQKLHCDGEILSHRLFVTSTSRLINCRASLFRSQVYGFKLRPSHVGTQRIIHPGRFLADLRAEGWRLIHLRRRDVLRTALSSVVRRQTGIVHRRVGDRSVAPRVRIRPADLLERLVQIDLEMHMEAEWLAPLPHLTMVYEDDLLRVESRQPALERAFGFLGLPSAPVRTQYARLAGDRLEDVVENYEDIVSILADTPYARFLAAQGP